MINHSIFNAVSWLLIRGTHGFCMKMQKAIFLTLIRQTGKSQGGLMGGSELTTQCISIAPEAQPSNIK